VGLLAVPLPLRVPGPSICSNRIRFFAGRRRTRYSRSGMSMPVHPARDLLDERLGEAAVAPLVLVRVLLQLFEDQAVRVRCGDPALDLRRVEGPLSVSSRLRPVCGSTCSTRSPSFRKTPFIRTSERTFTAS
jgi:hypothetical protein